MRLKLLRNLGTDLLKELGLEFKDDKGNVIYAENAVRDVEQAAADVLLKRGLAEATSEPITTLKAVAPRAAVAGVPAEVTPANIGKNPHDKEGK